MGRPRVVSVLLGVALAVAIVTLVFFGEGEGERPERDGVHPKEPLVTAEVQPQTRASAFTGEPDPRVASSHVEDEGLVAEREPEQVRRGREWGLQWLEAVAKTDVSDAETKRQYDRIVTNLTAHLTHTVREPGEQVEGFWFADAHFYAPVPEDVEFPRAWVRVLNQYPGIELSEQEEERFCGALTAAITEANTVAKRIDRAYGIDAAVPSSDPVFGRAEEERQVEFREIYYVFLEGVFGGLEESNAHGFSDFMGMLNYESLDE